MDKTKQRIAIAEAIGWEWITEGCQGSYQGIRPENTKRYCNWTRPAPAIDVDDAREWHWIPDFLNCLDAMHEAEKFLTDLQFNQFVRHLACFFTDHPDDGVRQAIHSSAAQRAEAFLKAVGRWEG